MGSSRTCTSIGSAIAMVFATIFAGVALAAPWWQQAGGLVKLSLWYTETNMILINGKVSHERTCQISHAAGYEDFCNNLMFARLFTIVTIVASLASTVVAFISLCCKRYWRRFMISAVILASMTLLAAGGAIGMGFAMQSSQPVVDEPTIGFIMICSVPFPAIVALIFQSWRLWLGSKAPKYEHEYPQYAGGLSKSSPVPSWQSSRLQPSAAYGQSNGQYNASYACNAQAASATPRLLGNMGHSAQKQYGQPGFASTKMPMTQPQPMTSFQPQLAQQNQLQSLPMTSFQPQPAQMNQPQSFYQQNQPTSWGARHSQPAGQTNYMQPQTQRRRHTLGMPALAPNQHPAQLAMPAGQNPVPLSPSTHVQMQIR